MAEFEINPPGTGAPAGDQGALANVGLETAIKVEETVKRVRDILASLPKLGEDLGKKFQKAQGEMKGLVLLADTAEEAFKGISDYTKGLTKTLAGDKSLKNMRATLEALRESAEEAKKITTEGSKGYKSLQTTIEGVNKRLSETERLTEETFDPSRHADYISFLKSTNKELEKMSTLAGRVAKPFFAGTAGIRKSLVDAGIMKAGKIEKYAAYGEAAVKLREAAKLKREERTQELAEHRGKAQKKLLDIPGMKEKFQTAGILTAAGDIDWAKAASNRKALKVAAGGAAGAGDTMALLRGGITGPKTGLGRFMGGGAVESAVGGVAGLVGQAAIPLAIAEAVKDLVVSIIDKNAEMNKQAESLAAGGILTGTGVTGADALLAVRANLSMPAGQLFSQYGLGLERNVKMAQAIIQSGYNIEGVAGGGPRGVKREGEFGPGAFGEIQQIAATSGRVVGLGDEQSIGVVMKMLMQYRESMEGTSAFFTNLTKDSRAAGISAAKYISILDDVLGHFDRMNKSLDQVVGTMGMLSRTGRSTAEDLQATMGMLTGAGRQPMDIAATAYVAMQMKATPGTMGRIQGIGEQNVQSAAQNVAESLRGLGITGYGKEKVAQMLMDPQGRDDLRALIDTQHATGKFDVQKIINAQATVEGASSAARGLDYTKMYMQGQLSAVDYGSAMLSKGMSPQESENFRRQAMETMLTKSGYSIRDIVDQKKPIDAKLKLMMEQALPGFTAEDVGTYGKALRDTAAARFDMAAHPDEFIPDRTKDKAYNDAQKVEYDKKSEDRAQRLADEIAKIMPEYKDELTNKGKMSYIQLLRKWESDPHNLRGKMVRQLEVQTSTQNELMNSHSETNGRLSDQQLAAKKAEVDEKARSTARVTQNTAEIFANVFSTYFNQIIGILEQMRRWMAHSPLFGGVTAGGEKLAADTIKDLGDSLDTAAAANQLRIKSLESRLQRSDLKDEDRADIEKQLVDEQQKANVLAERKKFGVGSGLSVWDVKNLASVAAGETAHAYEPITDAMNALGVTLDKAGDYTLTPEQYKQQADLIGTAAAGKLVDVTQQTGEQGDRYVIHITNNSASMNLKTNALDSASKSVETTQAEAP